MGSTWAKTSHWVQKGNQLHYLVHTCENKNVLAQIKLSCNIMEWHASHNVSGYHLSQMAVAVSVCFNLLTQKLNTLFWLKVIFQVEPYLWRPCGVTWDSSLTVVVIKLWRTSALQVCNVAWGHLRIVRKLSLPDCHYCHSPASVPAGVGAPAAEGAWWSVGRDYDNSIAAEFCYNWELLVQWSVTQFPLNSQKSKRNFCKLMRIWVSKSFLFGRGLCLLESYILRKVITKLL